MCGIVGQFGGNIDARVLRQMASTIKHRGPDDAGVWIDERAEIGFAHRRLSIVDISKNGVQPMASASGRYTICFNGEIYNHSELRSQLEACGGAPENGWHGHSDTETFLAVIEWFGWQKSLQMAVGMFAIAVWDRKEHLLLLSRDRMGEKPLYYGFVGKNLVFGSEISVFEAHPDFQSEICPDAVDGLLRRNYIPAPYSIYKSIYKLPQASWLAIGRDEFSNLRSSLTDQDVNKRENEFIKYYWRIEEQALAGAANPFTKDDDAIEAIDAAFADSLKLQCKADVPVGAFLSGGVDSSAVVALLREHTNANLRTFTIGFSEPEYDESGHARRVAEHLETDHHEVVLTPQDAMDLIVKLPKIYSEPFADSSQIPSYFVSALAREHVTVSLSGDGGDELFGGYNRYLWHQNVWGKAQKAPFVARKLAGQILSQISNKGWDLAAKIPGPLNRDLLHLKAQKVARILKSSHSSYDVYASLLDEWQDGGSPMRNHQSTDLIPDLSAAAKNMDGGSQMMLLDMMTYLPDDILCKMDRASMAVGLESRVPMLDHRLVELSMRVPTDMKIRNGQGKWALRELLYRHVPKSIIDRPKTGFGIPVTNWVRGPLRDWSEALLSEQALGRNALLEVAPIRKAWSDHLSGKKDNISSLWAILMLQAFMEERKNCL